MPTSYKFTIHSNGSFSPSGVELPTGTQITFNLSGTDYPKVYVYSGDPLTSDSTLFGSSYVTTSAGGTIAAPNGSGPYTLWVSSSPPSNSNSTTCVPTAGTINVGTPKEDDHGHE